MSAWQLKGQEAIGGRRRKKKGCETPSERISECLGVLCIVKCVKNVVNAKEQCNVM